MIDVIPIFPSLNNALIDLLKGLKPQDWERKTVCSQWTVKDITVHLLDTNLRRLSLGRDGYSFLKNKQFATSEEMVGFLNGLNADWISAMKRLSPAIIIEMIEKYQNELLDYFADLDPFEMAIFPVRWAGKEHSENWFDIAREYTERWLHQQQIRYAVNDQKLLTPEFYSPYLQTAIQALPYTYLKIKAPVGTIVKVEVVGDAGNSWAIIKEKSFWSFINSAVEEPNALVYIDQQIAWLLFSKGINVEEAGQYFQLHGDRNLGSHALKMVSVMA